MTNSAEMNLDSYRLAQYAVHVPCYICDHGNAFDDELCRRCFAPMALAHQAQHGTTAPRPIATLGASGVGKTVYLGMLMDVLSRQPERMHILARGAFSITLQQTTIAAMTRCRFPDKTPSEPDRWNWVHCQVRAAQQRRPIEMVMPDLAGEALFQELEHPNSYRVIRSLLQKSAGVMVLVDAYKLQRGVLDQDYFAMKLLSYLSELSDNPKSDWRNRPISLVFTKCDQCEDCFEDPDAFAQKYTPGLWQHCKQRLRHFKFFAAGVSGTCISRNIPGEGRRIIPLRVEPRGIVEPFEWLVRRLKA